MYMENNYKQNEEKIMYLYSQTTNEMKLKCYCVTNTVVVR